jgi:hypothetical protein
LQPNGYSRLKWRGRSHKSAGELARKPREIRYHYRLTYARDLPPQHPCDVYCQFLTVKE